MTCDWCQSYIDETFSYSDQEDKRHDICGDCFTHISNVMAYHETLIRTECEAKGKRKRLTELERGRKRRRLTEPEA